MKEAVGGAVGGAVGSAVGAGVGGAVGADVGGVVGGAVAAGVGVAVTPPHAAASSTAQAIRPVTSKRRTLRRIIGRRRGAVKVDSARVGRVGFRVGVRAAAGVVPLDRLRWMAFGVALVVLFFIATAVGAFVGRQLNAPSSSPVGGTSPTPTAPLSPTLPPTPPPSPTPSPSPAPALTATPTAALATATPSVAPATQPPLDPAPAEQFAADLAAAVRGGDDDYLVAHLHPATTDRYGLRMCRRYIRQNVSGDNLNWEVHGATGPAAWDYVTDGLTTTIDDAWTVSVTQADATPPERELHFALADGTWRWFTDCGNPR